MVFGSRTLSTYQLFNLSTYIALKMKKSLYLLVLVNLLYLQNLQAQKKPLDHSVYDSWQHIGEKLISNDGKWIVYTIEPQQGDADLLIRSSDGKYSKSIPRGYTALITEDSRYLVCRIKAPFKEIREARIKKKKPEDFPKDSFAIIQLGKEEVWKTSLVKSYKAPRETAGWLAYHKEKPVVATRQKPAADKINTDSLNRVIDSLKQLLKQAEKKKKKKKDDDLEEDREMELTDDAVFAEADEVPGDSGSDLVLRTLSTGEEKIFSNVLEYHFSKQGNKLLLRQAKDARDTAGKPSVSVYDIARGELVTLIRGGNDFQNFTISDDGSRIAFVAERDSKPKDLVKFYKLWYFQQGWDTAIAVADRYSVGMPLGSTVSEFANLSFSKSGNRLFFGTSPNPIPRDTSIIDIDMPKLDVWHYDDEYLQTIQTLPARLRATQQQSFLAVLDTRDRRIQQLACREVPQVIITGEGDGDMFVGITDIGKRVESQWEGQTLKDVYAVYARNGEQRLVQQNVNGNIYASAGGRAIAWFDRKKKHYYAWDGSKTRNISEKLNVAFWNEDHDSPSVPGNYGLMGWHDGDSAVYVYDMYDVWKLDITGSKPALNITKGTGRREKVETRYIQLDEEKRYFLHGDNLLFRSFNKTDKKRGLRYFSTDGYRYSTDLGEQGFIINDIKAARDNRGHLIYTRENFNQPPDIYHAFINRDEAETHHDLSGKIPLVLAENKLSSINPQQSNYLWGTAELFHWKAYNGKDATGIVYKPENFDPKKKYPMIIYFYEKLSQDLYDYKEPAPIRSAINIPFFVSRGYVIFLPDISYVAGHPGKSAYDYIVSGARAVVKKGWADSTKIALQGHSWGGYQAAQLATMTKLFKAVWAGAPVANMTSAYGGIRWESGVSRQFQYEKTQSRLGVTPWEDLSLYIENSPLFHLDKVTAPMVIMHNDADGAVPWYQGIELFTGLRRLGKKVWMFNYNGQGHGLTQRQDMRDYQVRMQQFFDWILKGEYPARWITDGIPAVDKGRDLGY